MLVHLLVTAGDYRLFMAQMASRFRENLTMGNTAHDRASGDVQMDRGPARRTTSHQASLDFFAITNGGLVPDRRAANDRRRTSAKAIPMRMAGTGNGLGNTDCGDDRSQPRGAAGLLLDPPILIKRGIVVTGRISFVLRSFGLLRSLVPPAAGQNWLRRIG